MPTRTLTDFPQPVLSDYCYDFDNHHTQSLTTPKTFPTWQDLEVTSNPYHLPIQSHNAYEDPTEVYSPSPERFVAGREATLSAFMPTTRDVYQHYMGTESFRDRDRDSRWNTQKYRSQPVDYPTPQSNLSLSPPQHARESFGLCEPNSTGRSDRYADTSELAPSQRFFGDIPTPERPYTQQLRVSPQRRQSIDESEESDEDGSVNCEPYAQLIFRALKGAPGYGMVLKDIYRWFESNTDKARKSSKGWQNSIRHNLSMNGAFKKVDQDPSTDEAKKGFIWVLEPSALVDGVKSTTRYRKPGSNKKTGRGRHPAPERQRSGAKGGKAARKAAKIRQSARLEGARPRGREDIPLQSVEVSASNITGQPPTPSSIWTPDGIESFLSASSRALTPITAQQAFYDYGDIGGVTSMVPNGPLFPEDCDPTEAEDATAFHSFVADDIVASNHRPTLYKIEL
ncbi:MAG: hypothetical protein Q9225_001261 [Loekoesia sp. 1 TL-2023]